MNITGKGQGWRALLGGGLALSLLSGCAASRASQQEQAFYEQQRLINEAWGAARLRTLNTCRQPTPPEPCSVKLIKATNRYDLVDWVNLLIPSYTTVVRIHEEELRRRVQLRFYDEYLLGVSRFVAIELDNGNLDPLDGIRAVQYAFYQAGQAARQEAVWLRYSTLRAETEDRRWAEALAVGLIGLSQGLSSYLSAVQANRQALWTGPVTCVTSRVGYHTIINCY